MSINTEGNWTQSLNSHQYAIKGISGDICVPFAHFVQSESKDQGPATFPQFSMLPIELQLRIIHFCSPATLFQLMRVSYTRHEASKIFWSDPETWYHINGEWLLAGGYSGHTHYALNFLANVQQVEIAFDFEDSTLRYWDDGNKFSIPHLEPYLNQEQRFRNFWQTLQHIFPRAIHVVLSENSERLRDGTFDDFLLKEMIETCPAHLRVSISRLHYVKTELNLVQRRLWQRKQNNQGALGEWEIADQSWKRQIVLPPPKTFRGPVGIWQRFQYKVFCCKLRQAGLSKLHVPAVEGYYLEKEIIPFPCPYQGCNSYFEQPGQLLIHAETTKHRRQLVLPFLELRTWFKEQIRMDEQMCADDDEVLESMYLEWHQGSEQQRVLEQAVLHQLEHDPLYTHSRPPRESSFWKEFQSFMARDRRRFIRPTTMRFMAAVGAAYNR